MGLLPRCDCGAVHADPTFHRQLKIRYLVVSISKQVCIYKHSVPFVDLDGSQLTLRQRAGVLGLNSTECPGTVKPDGTVELCTNVTANAVAEGKFWVQYGDAMVAALGPLSKRHAAFLTNCPAHCQSSGSGWRHPAFPGTRLDAAVKQWYAEAIANIANDEWAAPRWIAKDGDKCVTPPASTSTGE